MSARDAPSPGRERWQPLRLGLVELFHYDEEEFWFRDGRLLLRGNNGTGKSKVLALTLPFLLDARNEGARVEPDGDRDKRMAWNLLLGGEHPNPERVGYTWLELGRRDDDGAERFLTLGCGMKAVRGRTDVTQWFFVTERRVGDGLALVDPAGVPLTRERLQDALGDDGRVFHQGVAGDGGFRARYRRAVDEALFRLGTERYEAMVDLLLRIRQPQLSKRPSEAALSTALTEALPPLDSELLDDLATAFRTLEDDRQHLRGLVEAGAAAEEYVEVYGRYARLAARRQAVAPRQAQSRIDDINRRVIVATQRRDEASALLRAASDRADALVAEDGELAARRRALDESDAAKSAEQLEAAEQRVQDRADAASRAAEDELEAAEDDHRAAAALAAAEDAAERTAGTATALAAETRDAATTAGLDADTRSALATATDDGRAASRSATDAEPDASSPSLVETGQEPSSPSTVDPGEDARARAAVDAGQDARARAVATLRGRIAAVDLAQRELRRAAGELEAVEPAVQGVELARADADERVATAREALEEQTRELLGSWQELRIADADELAARYASWAIDRAGGDPLAAAAGDAALVVTRRLDAERGTAERRLEALAVEQSELAAEIARLERGEDDEPAPPPTRSPDARTGRAGAPLWRLVEFADDLDDAACAGLEGGLQAAGLLDAWVTPDGRLRATTPEGDETIVADDAPSASDGIGLSGVLTPTVDDDSGVEPAVVSELLRRIGLLSADADGLAGDVTPAQAERTEAAPVRAAVSVRGDWRNGLLRGRWAKDRAAFVGRVAREAARRRRLQDAEALAVRLREEVAALEAEIEALVARQRRVEAERDARPDEGPLRAASADLVKAVQALAAATERLARATTVRDTAREALDDADAEVARTADDLRLPRDLDALETVEAALRRLPVLLPQLWSATDRRREDHVRLAEARATRGQAAVRLTERTGRRAAADAGRRDAEVFRDTLAATVGTAVEELQRRRGEVSVRRRQIEQELKSASAEREAAGRAEAAEQRDLEVRAEELTAEEERRTAAADRLRRFASTGVLTAALPDLELPTTDGAWSDTAAVRVARRIDAALADEPDGDEAWRRSLRAVGDDVTPLAEALVVTGDHVAVQTVDEGILVVGVRFRGDELSVAGLAEALRVDVEERRRILGEREREILENHLVDEVAATLQRRISDAEHQVERMTRELGARPTSTGMQLRLRWVPVADGPAGLGAARQRLMRQSAAVWSAEDRAAVGQFLRAQIDALRAADPSRPWLEHLTEAFDYRSWHRFVVERRGPGGWTSATGPASGGERVLAATVPLFAAASAHYGSAGDQHAPRLVLLDEAFAGVDDDSRAKCLGLLTAFDLDVVMTSEREWGCYPEVPGLAISQLSRVEGYDAILVTPWEWDGRTRTQVDPPPRAERRTVLAATDPPPIDPDQVSLLDALDGGIPVTLDGSGSDAADNDAADSDAPDDGMSGPT